MMLATYTSKTGRLAKEELSTIPAESILWADLLHPTKDEEALIEKKLGIDIPTREEMKSLEASNRFYVENDAIFMTAHIIANADSPAPESTSITFILTPTAFVTVRYSEPHSFNMLANRISRGSITAKAPIDIFFALAETITDRLSEIIEKVSAEVNGISRKIFQDESQMPKKNKDLSKILRQIGRQGDLNDKARESMASIAHILEFLSLSVTSQKNHKDMQAHIKTLLKDMLSLTDYSSFIANKTTFLLEATLGLIDIAQNSIIKIFSVAAVVFLPPTLIASIYGMNFQFMPELHWKLGYPFAIILMIISALLPYVYFKRKGWL